MCANSKGSGETEQMRRLAWAFAGLQYDKFHISWAGSFVEVWLDWLTELMFYESVNNITVM